MVGFPESIHSSRAKCHSKDAKGGTVSRMRMTLHGNKSKEEAFEEVKEEEKEGKDIMTLKRTEE